MFFEINGKIYDSVKYFELVHCLEEILRDELIDLSSKYGFKDLVHEDLSLKIHFRISMANYINEI